MKNSFFAAALIATATFASAAQAQQLGYTEGGDFPVAANVSSTGALSRSEVQAQAAAARQAGLHLQYTESAVPATVTAPVRTATALSRAEVRAQAYNATHTARGPALQYTESSM